MEPYDEFNEIPYVEPEKTVEELKKENLELIDELQSTDCANAYYRKEIRNNLLVLKEYYEKYGDKCLSDNAKEWLNEEFDYHKDKNY